MICNADKLKKFISDVMKSAGLPEMDSKNFAESLSMRICVESHLTEQHV